MAQWPRCLCGFVYWIANTYTAPPVGTGGCSPGTKLLTAAVAPCTSPPHPDSTARYCLPSIRNVVGGARTPELRGSDSHNNFPVPASKAWIFRSDVPPLITRPPAVASIEPQFGDAA